MPLLPRPHPKWQGPLRLRLPLLAILTGVLLLSPASLAAQDDPCNPPTCCCPTASCVPPLPDCGGGGEGGGGGGKEPCFDKYGNPIDCPLPPAPPPGPCYDKYGHLVECPNDEDSCYDEYGTPINCNPDPPCECCDSNSAMYSAAVAAAGGCPIPPPPPAPNPPQGPCYQITSCGSRMPTHVTMECVRMMPAVPKPGSGTIGYGMSNYHRFSYKLCNTPQGVGLYGGEILDADYVRTVTTKHGQVIFNETTPRRNYKTGTDPAGLICFGCNPGDTNMTTWTDRWGIAMIWSQAMWAQHFNIINSSHFPLTVDLKMTVIKQDVVCNTTVLGTFTGSVPASFKLFRDSSGKYSSVP